MGIHEKLLQLLHSDSSAGGGCCHDTEFWRLPEAQQGEDKGGIQSCPPHSAAQQGALLDLSCAQLLAGTAQDISPAEE